MTWYRECYCHFLLLLCLAKLSLNGSHWSLTLCATNKTFPSPEVVVTMKATTPSKKSLRTNFLNFSGSTTLHGWHYLSQKPYLWFDSLFWIFILAVVHVIGFYFVYSNTAQALKDFLNYLYVMVVIKWFARIPRVVGSFPAITNICSRVLEVEHK